MNEREKALTEWLEKHDAVLIKAIPLSKKEEIRFYYLAKSKCQEVLVFITDKHSFSWNIYIQPTRVNSFALTLDAADKILATNG